jgi:catechol 2,3-dioxygenase
VKIQSLGHVVVKVRSAQRSEDFYSGVLGIPVVSRISDPVRMTFFSLGVHHHDFAVLEVGKDASAPAPTAIGLAHIAFEIGDCLEEYRSAEAELESAQITVLYTADRTFAKSMHVRDPDGNEVELYIDTSHTRNPRPDAGPAVAAHAWHLPAAR